ncbi:MAG: serine/threonine-protein kinase, partial [Acidobacteriota bacterium]
MSRLGSGGMGTVFLAERVDEIRQRVAVKVLHLHLAGGGAAARFRLEKQLLATLDHPHIAGLLDHGTTSDEQPYLVMEWVDGAPITDYCDRFRLGLDRRLGLVRDVAEALHYAHRHRVVHRDIKPSNILVSDDGVAKLLDFGIAKTLEGSRFDDKAPESTAHARPLSPAYASPEQLGGDAVTTASDLYSLAVVTFELLSGSSPFRRVDGSIKAMQALYRRTEPPSLADAVADGDAAMAVAKARRLTPSALRRELADDVAAVLAKALHPEAERRYASVAQFADDLRRCRTDWPVAARPATTPYRLRKLVRRNPLSSALLGAAAVATLTLTVALGVQSHRLAEERDVAVREEQRAARVTHFLADIFRRIDPEHAGGPASSQQRLLDAAQRIGDQFADEPATEAKLLDLVAHALQNLGELDEAAP